MRTFMQEKSGATSKASLLSALPVLCVIALGAARGFAGTTVVTGADNLAATLARARPGDEIVLQDGAYRGTFTLANSGTADRPITIRPQHPQQAIFSRSLIALSGNHGVLTGFVFERSQVTISGDYNRVAHSVFRFSDDRPAGMQAAVRTLGDASHNRIHHNEITDWSTYGFRVLQPTKRTTANRIDHNYIHDYSNTRSSNEPEAIQIGSNNTISNLNVATVIEYNLVERVRITGELLSLKTSGNIVRGNTFVDIHGAVQGRHGNNNTFINNTIIGGKAVLRAYGDSHRLIGNRLTGGADIIVPAGDVTQDALQKPDGKGGHPVARHQWVAVNVVEGGGRILVGKGLQSAEAHPAEDTTLAGNTGLVVKDGPELKQKATRTMATYGGDPGQPVVMTREQVGPGAPDPQPEPGEPRVGRDWQEDFSAGMTRWWSEGGERVWVEEGRLHEWADKPDQPGGGVATVWCREPLPADFECEVEARVISSSISANNINLFFCYSDPSGRPLEETREARRTADYRFYHGLNGYIVTFLNEDGQARIRLRRNPGFNLLVEDRVGECRAGVTYRMKFRKQEGEIVFSVDGRELARFTDPAPWRGGLFGLRTFRTNLWWDNIRVRRLAP
ncbi:MAG: DUF1961 family protein [Opitutaceae bacterium]|nr:DUF1961 family protein [Opitutaceae bacterium]